MNPWSLSHSQPSEGSQRRVKDHGHALDELRVGVLGRDNDAFLAALKAGGEKHTVSGRITAVEEISDLQVVVHTPSEVKTIALAQADTKVSKK